MNQSTSTRVYLSVHRDDNDLVKKYGGRFDWDRMQWWVDRTQVAQHPAIARWIPDPRALAAQLREAADLLDGTQPATPPKTRTESTTGRSTPRKAGKRAKEPAPDRRGDPIPATTFLLPCCDCSSPPWEHCEHTRPQGLI